MIIVKYKKYFLISIIILICIIAYTFFAKPIIEKRTWVLSYVQQAEPLFVVAHNKDYDFADEESFLFKFSKPIELTLEAKNGKLKITDSTNGKTYEGTYKVKSWSKFTNQSYVIVVDGVEGTANLTSRLGRQLFISIGDYYLFFEAK